MKTYSKKIVHDSGTNNTQNQALNKPQNLCKSSGPTTSEPSVLELTISSDPSPENGDLDQSNRKILSNKDCLKESYANKDFILKSFNEVEKEIYQSHQNKIDQLVELHKNRKPKKIIIVTDERDVFTENKVCTKTFQYRVFKGVNLNLGNLFRCLSQDPDFGSGVLYVIFCGINSINEERLNASCVSNRCTLPYKCLDNTAINVNLIEMAIQLHKSILSDTVNDTVIFSGLFPSSPNYFNNFSYQWRKCAGIHKSFPPLDRILWYDNYNIFLYNTFTKILSKLMGFDPLNFEKEAFIINYSVNSRKPIVYAKFNDILSNGYNFTTNFASKRKSTILKTCDKLMEKLLKGTSLELQDNQRINTSKAMNDFCIAGATKQFVNSTKDGKCNEVEFISSTKSSSAEELNDSLEEGEIVSDEESVDKPNHSILNEGVETKLNSAVPSVLQLNGSSVKDRLNQLESPQPKAVTSEAAVKRKTKYDKVVILGNTRYYHLLKTFNGPKVCIMPDDISLENLLSYIERKKALMPQKTLWVLIIGIDFLFYSSIRKSCSLLNCNDPLRTTFLTDRFSTTARASAYFIEMKEYLEIKERSIKRILWSGSDFLFYPPIPPTMIIETVFTHQDLHELISVHQKGYIVANGMVSHISDIFEHVCVLSARLTWLALTNIQVSVDPLEKYIDNRLYKIDFINSTVTQHSNKLHFFTEWLKTFKNIMTSCMNDPSCFGTSVEEENFTSFRKVVPRSDGNVENKSCKKDESLLYKNEKIPSSETKLENESITSVNKNQCLRKKDEKQSFMGALQSVLECASSTSTLVKKISSQMNINITESSGSSKTSGNLEILSNKTKELPSTKNKDENDSTCISNMSKLPARCDNHETSQSDSSNTRAETSGGAKITESIESLTHEYKSKTKVSMDFSSSLKSSETFSNANKESALLMTKEQSNIETSPSISSVSLHTTVVDKDSEQIVSTKWEESKCPNETHKITDGKLCTSKLMNKSLNENISKGILFNLPSDIIVKECFVYLKDIMKRKKYLRKYNLYKLSNKENYQIGSKSSKPSSKCKNHKRTNISKDSIKEKYISTKSITLDNNNSFEILDKSSKHSCEEKINNNNDTNNCSKENKRIGCKSPKHSSDGKHRGVKSSKLSSKSKYYRDGKDKHHGSNKMTKFSDKVKHHSDRKVSKFYDKDKHHNSSSKSSKYSKKEKELDKSKMAKHTGKDNNQIKNRKGNDNADSMSIKHNIRMAELFGSTEDIFEEENVEKRSSQMNKGSAKTCKLKNKDAVDQKLNPESNSKSFEDFLNYSFQITKPKITSKAKDISKHKKHKDKNVSKKVSSAPHSTKKNTQTDSSKLLYSHDKHVEKHITSKGKLDSGNKSTSFSSHSNSENNSSISKQKRKSKEKSLTKANAGEKSPSHHGDKTTPGKRLSNEDSPSESPSKKIKGKSKLDVKSHKNSNILIHNIDDQSLKNIDTEFDPYSKKLRDGDSSDTKMLKRLSCDISENSKDSIEIGDLGDTVKLMKNNSLESSSIRDQPVSPVQVNNSGRDSPNDRSVSSDYQNLNKNEKETSLKRRNSSQEPHNNISTGTTCIPQAHTQKLCSLNEEIEKQCESVIIMSKSDFTKKLENTSNWKKNLSKNCESKNINEEVSDEIRTDVLKHDKGTLSKLTNKELKDEDVPKTNLNGITKDETVLSLDKNHQSSNNNETMCLVNEAFEDSEDVENFSLSTSEKLRTDSSETVGDVQSSESVQICRFIKKSSSQGLINSMNKNEKECNPKREATELVSKNEECLLKRDSTRVKIKSNEKCETRLMNRNTEECEDSTQLMNKINEECNTQLMNMKEEESLKRNFTRLKNKNNTEGSLEREITQDANDKPVSKTPVIKPKRNIQKPCPLSKKRIKKSKPSELVDSNSYIKANISSAEETTPIKNHNVLDNGEEIKPSKAIDSNEVFFFSDVDVSNVEMQSYILNCAKETLLAFIGKEVKDEDIPKGIISLCKENEVENIKEDDSISSLYENLKKVLVLLHVKYESTSPDDFNDNLNTTSKLTDSSEDFEVSSQNSKYRDLSSVSLQASTETDSPNHRSVISDHQQVQDKDGEEKCSLKRESTQNTHEKISNNNEIENHSEKKDDGSSLNNDELSDKMIAYVLKSSRKTLSAFTDEEIKDEDIPNAIISLCKRKGLHNIKEDESMLSLHKNLKQYLVFSSKQYSDLPLNYFYDVPYSEKITNKSKYLLSESFEDSGGSSDSYTMPKKSRKEASQNLNICDDSSANSLSHNKGESNPKKRNYSPESHSNPSSSGITIKTKTYKQKPCPLSKKSVKNTKPTILTNSDSSIKAEVNSSNKPITDGKSEIFSGETGTVEWPLSNTDISSKLIRPCILNCAKEILSEFNSEDASDDDIPKAIISLCKKHNLDNIKEDESLVSLDRNIKQFMVFLSIGYDQLPLTYYYNAPYHLFIEEFSQHLAAQATRLTFKNS